MYDFMGRPLTQPEWFFGPYNPGASRPNFSAYKRPKQATFLGILAVGGGGLGGNGFTRAAGNAGGGGGGGGSGAAARLIIPWDVLPDTIFIMPGHGGVSGQSAIGSCVAIYPDDNLVANRILLANAGGAGGNGSAASAGSAGTAGGAGTAATNIWQNLGIVTWIAGIAGAPGGSQTGGTGSVTGWASGGLPLSGGSGGGGTTSGDFGGGSFTDTPIGTFLGGASSGSANGQNGIFVPRPMLGVGGTGGGSRNSSAGGSGGNGAPGCGGGGGGAGTTGGTGGRGGNGFIVIWNW